MSAIIEYGVRAGREDKSWSRQGRVKEPPLREPERMPAKRGPLRWFDAPERVAEAAASSWGGPYDWAGV